jgi:hypothetical protein
LVEVGEGFGGAALTKRSRPAVVIFAHLPARAHICSSKARAATSRSPEPVAMDSASSAAFQHRKVRARPQRGHQMGGVAQ